MKMYQHISAPNNNNGNPRRLYVVYSEEGEILGAVDEGYKGIDALNVAGFKPRTMIELMPINISASEYESILKDWELKK